MGCGETGHGIGRAGTGGHQTDAGFTCGPRIAIGHVHRTLFMTGEDEVNGGEAEHIENVQDGAAGVAEDHLAARMFEPIHHALRATARVRILRFLLLHVHLPCFLR